MPERTDPASPSSRAASDRAIRRIKIEHKALACVLGAMQALVAQGRDPGAKPDLVLLESMLRYIENVPDRLHHPREDQALFPAVARDAIAGRNLVRDLEREHARGAPMLAELRRSLGSLRKNEPNALNQLATAVDEFAEFYWWHMRKEEEQLLPLALQHLDTEEWRRVDSAFGDNTDPLFGAELAEEYRQLYQRIAELAPRSLRALLESGADTGNA